MNKINLDPSDISLLIEEMANRSPAGKCAGESVRMDSEKYLQHTLRDIWEKVLGFSSFEFNDDLFDVGGDSVAAIQIFSEINKRFGIRIPMENIFSAEKFSLAWLTDLVEARIVEVIGRQEYEALLKEMNDLTAEALISERSPNQPS